MLVVVLYFLFHNDLDSEGFRWCFVRIVKIILVIFMVISVTITIGWQILKRNNHLSFVPSEMNVTSIIYVQERAWGFGPGGNETGFIVYDLPVDVLKKIDDKGIEYLSSFPSARLGKPHGWQRKYREWHNTPFPSEDNLGLKFHLMEVEHLRRSFQII